MLKEWKLSMRSEYVFAAAKRINNRFLLCRVTSVSARHLQIGSKQPSETINKSLNLIAAATLYPGGDITGGAMLLPVSVASLTSGSTSIPPTAA
jgi:hypothetical protein